MLRLKYSVPACAAKVQLRGFSTSIQRLKEAETWDKINRGSDNHAKPARKKNRSNSFASNIERGSRKRGTADKINRPNVEVATNTHQDSDITAKKVQLEAPAGTKIGSDEKGEVYSSVDSLLKTPFFQNMRQHETVGKGFKEIVADEVDRFDIRFRQPTARWMKNVQQDIMERYALKNIDKLPFSSLIEKYYGKPKFHITATEIFDSLEVGDAVEFSKTLDQSIMSVIVELPSKDDDPRYTVMDRKGELHFCEKSTFKLRIPKLIPKGWIRDIVEKTDIDSSGYASIKTTLDHQYEMFNVNPLARRTIVAPLINVTNLAWESLPDVSQQLEAIHRLCQKKGPTQISLFQLYRAVETLRLKAIKGKVSSASYEVAYKVMSRSLTTELGSDFNINDDSLLGKDIGSLDPETAYSVPLLYSIILALKKQNTLWSTSYTSRSAMLPLSVTVNPLDYVHRARTTINTIKKNSNLRTRFVRFIERGDFASIPKEFDDILFLLKEYSVGNITDAVSESVICQLVKLPENLQGIDVTRTKIYDLLSKIGYINTTMANPVHYSSNLSFPGKNVSVKADREQDYYEFSDDLIDRDFDLSKDVRKDFGDMKVYCIDSETAHEIDDGVAIERIDENNANIHIHIADPASYLTPKDTISKIAFERAFTTYQPETISAMLPMSLVNLSGLGIEGQKTRAMTFSVPYNFNTGKVDITKAEVQPSYVSKFPKYTYNTVDQTLLKTKNQEVTSMNDEERDLTDLFRIAQSLRQSRVEQGAILFGESFGTNVRVLPKGENEAKSNASFIDASLDDHDVIFSKDHSTDSQLLVSELMILANTISGSVLKERGYSGIYKGMTSPKSTGSAAHVIDDMNKMIQQGSLPMMKDIAKCIKFIVPAIYSHSPKRHIMLACETYAPSTSPLRRFGDLVNHWQFHNMAKAEPSRFTEGEMLYMTQHIEVRNDILKGASRNASNYYCLRYIKDQLDNGVTPKLSFFTWSRPNGRYVNGIIPEFGILASLKLNRNCRPPELATTITNFDIETLDPVAGTIELKQIESVTKEENLNE